MKRLFVLAVLLLGVVSFYGCGSGGGGDSSLPVPASGNPAGGTPAGGDTGGGTPTQPGTTVGPAAQITLQSALPAGTLLSQGGQTTVTATVRDANNNPVADGTLVNFVANGGTVTTSSTTVNGVATATFQAGSRSGPVTITANCDTATSQVSIQIATGAPSSILVESVQPRTIGVFSSGIEDASLVTFLVRDGAGNPVPDGTKVNFAVGTGVSGGEKLTATGGTTAGGKATVSLQSGTVAGTVSVIGTIDGLTISTVAQVTIANNRPDAGRITIGAETLNLAGGVTLGLQSPIHAYLGDRAGNVVPDGTPVSFLSECGTIGSSQGFEATTEFGVATATFQTSAPTVPDLDGLAPAGNVGLCTLVAMTPGKGAFRDNNGNGIFDAGDVCDTQLDEPYIDANDSGAWNTGEYYVDVNKNGKFDSDVVDCQNDAMIWTSMNVLNSDDVGQISLFPTSFEIPIGGSQPFTFNVSDLHGNALVAGTKISVTTTAGTLAGTTEYVQPDTTGLGRQFSFALLSDKEAGATPKAATVKVTITPPGGVNNNGAELSQVAMGSINLPLDDPGLGPAPAPSSGDPATILFDVNTPQIFVAGVGRTEMSTLMLQVVDSSGQPIDEAAYNNNALNNIRVSFITSPNGGEYLSGEAADASGNSKVVDSRASGSILVRSDKGLAPINLQAGTLPGSVEIKAEVLYDAEGNPLGQPITASLPQIAIASGPPHTINLTYARASAENLGAGVYRRRATAMVTDRYGNTVPDGTSIYLGLLDSVIAQGTTTSVSGSAVTAPAGAFDVSIKRNETNRKIQAKDRVILREVPAQDKSRYVSSRTGSTLTVQTPYSADYADLPYFVGASLLGGSVGGTLLSGASATGTTQTKGGLADVYVTYPANINTIGVGCGDIPARDLRYSPLGSAKVFLVAESSSAQGDPDLPAGSQFDDRATTIDEGTYCFAPMAGFTLSILPSVKLTATDSRGLKLEDGGDQVPLPFWPLSSYVAVDARGKGNLCKDPAPATPAACSAAGKTWLTSKNLCYDPNVTAEATCTAPNVWMKDVASDFTVDVYLNPFGKTGGVFDLDKDGFDDIFYRNATDTNANGIPDDIDGDGKMDVYDGNVIGWKFDTTYNRYLPQAPSAAGIEFYTYPYTGIDATASALIVVRGQFLQTGDKATVTFLGGDGEASVTVEIP